MNYSLSTPRMFVNIIGKQSSPQFGDICEISQCEFGSTRHDFSLLWDEAAACKEKRSREGAVDSSVDATRLRAISPGAAGKEEWCGLRPPPFQ